MRLRNLLLGFVSAATLTLAGVAAEAQPLTLLGVGTGANGTSTCIVGPTVCAIYQGHFESTTDSSTSYVQTAGTLGTATLDRVIVLALQSASSASASIGTPTCGLISLTKALDSTTTTVFNQMWYGSIPTGTTCDITVPVASGTLQRMAFDWWTVTNTTQVTYSARSPSGGTITVTSGTTFSTPSFTVPSGGIAFAMARSSAVPTGFTCNSGTCNIRHNGQVGAEGQYDMVGDSGVAGSGQTWTVTVGSTNNLTVGAIAWAP